MERKVLKKQNNSDMCIVCGMDNPLSLKTMFYAVEGDLMVGLVTAREEHQSYPGRMHGGMISALLDEAIGRAVNIAEPETFGVTTELNVKFKKPVPLGAPLKIVGWLTKNTRLVFQGAGHIEDEAGNVLATATATYVKMTSDKIAGEPLTEKQWFLTSADERDPASIEIRGM